MTGADERDNPFARIFSRDAQYLVTEGDLDRLDTLIGALNAAITEILTRRPVQHELLAPTPAQEDFSNQVNEILSRPEPQR